MKVRFTKEAKEIFTVLEMPAVRQAIEAEKENEWSPETLAVYAMGVYDHFKGKELVNNGFYSSSMGHWNIYDATAEICKNERVWNLYGENSGHIDVWLKWIAVNEYYGAVECGICLSDAYSISIEADDNKEIYSHMYKHTYSPMKKQA